MRLLRCGLVAAALAVPISAWAQYAPFQPPGGLAPATMVGSQTLAQMQAATVAAQALAAAAMPSAALLDAQGRVKLTIAGDVTVAPVTPSGGSPTTLGAYLGTLAKSSDQSAYLTAQAASETYATLSALGETDSVAHAAQATAQAAVPSAALLDAQGRVMVPVVGDVTGAPVVPAGGSSVNLGTYLGTLATRAGLVAETSRATGAEAVLQGNIGTEAAARANADALLAPMNNPVFTGSMTVGTNSSSTASLMNGPTESTRQIGFESAGSFRWGIGTNNEAETGDNAGSNFFITASTDTGAFNYVALMIDRATGVANFHSSAVFGGRVSAPLIQAQSLIIGENNTGIYYDTNLRAFVFRTSDGTNAHFTTILQNGVFNFAANPTSPTPPAGDNSSNVATTAGVRAEIASGYTVATLPSDGRRYVGARAYVTDATACNFMASPTGGGATFCPVISNGTVWIAE